MQLLEIRGVGYITFTPFQWNRKSWDAAFLLSCGGDKGRLLGIVPNVYWVKGIDHCYLLDLGHATHSLQLAHECCHRHKKKSWHLSCDLSKNKKIKKNPLIWAPGPLCLTIVLLYMIKSNHYYSTQKKEKKKVQPLLVFRFVTTHATFSKGLD